MSTIDSKYCTFYIVRHGETIANFERILQGHSDKPLTEDGIRKAKLLGEKFKFIHFDHVFSSDLLRAKRTAELVMLERKMVVTTKKILRERTFGSYEGKSYQFFDAELRKQFEIYEKLTNQEKYSFKFDKDIESDEEIVSRLITFLREASLVYAGKTVLVVSHGGIMTALLIHLGFGTYDNLLPGSVKNLGYFKLLSDGSDFFVKETEGIAKI